MAEGGATVKDVAGRARPCACLAAIRSSKAPARVDTRTEWDTATGGFIEFDEGA